VVEEDDWNLLEGGEWESNYPALPAQGQAATSQQIEQFIHEAF